MAIFGWNFNNKPIPQDVRRRFTEFKRIEVGKKRVSAILVGVADNETEKSAMVVQGTNETRRFHIEMRKLHGSIWYGLYAYHVEVK